MSEFHSVFLSPNEAKAAHDALLDAGKHKLASQIREKAKRSEIDQRYADTLDLPDENEFAIDEDPVVSPSDDGAFVMVWQWVDSFTD
jgi:hypothetical protein